MQQITYICLSEARVSFFSLLDLVKGDHEDGACIEVIWTLESLHVLVNDIKDEILSSAVASLV